MQRKNQALAMVGMVAAPIGGVLGRLHVIGPNPGTFFALGVLAALAPAAVTYGVRQGVRAVRSKGRIGV